MGILAEDIARVREATDFVELAGEHIALKRVGQRYTGLCPFHAEKTPSFSINADEKLFYCFGCQAKGSSLWTTFRAYQVTVEPWLWTI